MVEVVQARTQLRKAGARFTGRCPFHEERTPSFSVNPQDKLYYCFGCGAGGDIISVRPRDRAARLRAGGRVAGRALPRDARVRGVLAGARRASAAGASGCWRCSSRRRASTSAISGTREAGGPARAYLEGRGLGEEVCREYRLGLAPGGATLARKAREKGFTAAELAAAGLVNRRGNDYFAGRLLFPLADAARAGARLPGAQAARGRPAAREVRQLARGRALPQGRPALRARPRADGDREAGARDRRRGQHRRARAAPGGARAGRRLDGDRADRAPAQGADAADAQALPLLRRRRRRRGGDAARDGARDRARARRAGGGAAARARPGRRGRRLRGAARRRRELSRLPRPAGDRADAGPAGGVRPRPGGALALRRLAGAAGCCAACGRPARPAEGDAGRLRSGQERARDRRRSRRGCSRRARASSATRSPAWRAHPELRRLLAELAPEHFDAELHRRARAHLLEPPSPTPSSCRCWPSSTPGRPTEGIDDETAKELLLRLRERQVRRELAAADLERTKELQEQLEAIRATAANRSTSAPLESGPPSTVPR